MNRVPKWENLWTSAHQLDVLIGASLHSIYIVLIHFDGGTAGEGQQHSLKMRTRVSKDISSWNGEEDDDDRRKTDGEMNGAMR